MDGRDARFEWDGGEIVEAVGGAGGMGLERASPKLGRQ